MPEPSILDERLAEIDRRLRTIQSGLVPVPDEEPAGESAARGAGDSAADAVTETVERAPEPLRLVEPAPLGDETRLADLVAAHERLLELHRELLSQYAEVLERRAGESASVAVNAGPFTTAAAVREFERALAALPGVHAVTVREYVGDDRVQVDVHLAAG